MEIGLLVVLRGSSVALGLLVVTTQRSSTQGSNKTTTRWAEAAQLGWRSSSTTNAAAGQAKSGNWAKKQYKHGSETLQKLIEELWSSPINYEEP